MLAALEELFGHGIMRHGRREVDDNLNRRIRENLIHSQDRTPVFLRHCTSSFRILITATNDIEYLKRLSHGLQIGIADDATSDDRCFYRLDVHRLALLILS